MIQINEVVGNTPLVDIINNKMPNLLTRDEEVALNKCQMFSASTYVVMNDEELMCVWGLIPPSILSTEVYLWLHVTPSVQGHHFQFVRHTQMVLQEILKDYEVVVGQVRTDAPQNRKFVKMLGAKFGETADNFTQFRIERKWQ